LDEVLIEFVSCYMFESLVLTFSYKSRRI